MEDMKTLYYTNPELRDEWDGIIEDMKKYMPVNLKVKWKCKTGKECHRWETKISNRKGNSARGCPYCSNKKICSKESCWCNSLWSLKPELRTEWFGNMDDMKLYPLHSGDKVKWKCKTNKDCHIYESRISDRTRIEGTTNCPYCCVPVKKICSKEGCWCNSLWKTNPELKEIYDGDINDLKKYTNGSEIKIKLKCKSGKECHKWYSTINHQTGLNSRGCPYCSNKQICSKEGCWCNSLWMLNPELRSEWDGNIEDMKKFSISSNQVVRWKCKTGKDCHKYESTINRKNNSNLNCPFCYNRQICSKQGCWCNSLWALKPELRTEWNGNIEDMKLYSIFSHIKSSWICYKKHIWITNISTRNCGHGCPYCINKTEQKIYDKIITFYPLIKQQYKIEWCKNKTYLPFDFVLENDKIIIEIDGIQHFEQISNWTSPEETHINDKYKMKCANNNSFSVIRLLQSDVFYDTYNWLEELKTNIEKLKNENIVQNIYMCKDNEYEIFQNL